MQQQLKLEVSLEEVNMILASLAKQPYEVVFKTLENLRSQAEKQVNASASESAAELSAE
jgi:hypothetical protein